MKRFFARACGRVQGVGFRYFVQQTAKKYELTGWVKNMPDGSVAMEVQYYRHKEIRHFFAELEKQKNELGINVQTLEKKELEPLSFEDDFSIKY